MQDEKKLQQEVIVPLTEKVRELTITTAEDYAIAAQLGKESKSAQKQVTGFFYDIKANAHRAWKSIVAKENDYLAPLKLAEKHLKKMMLEWTAEQDRKRREEEARLQAKAEAEAERERQRLLKRSEKLKTPELKEEAMEAAQAVQAPVVRVAEAPKVKGVSYRTKWKARVVDLGETIEAAATQELPKSFLVIDESKLNAFASSTKGNVPVPGVEFYEEKIIAVR